MMLKLASGKARLLITILITSFNAAQGQRGLTELSREFLEIKPQAHNVSNAHETFADKTTKPASWRTVNNKQTQKIFHVPERAGRQWKTKVSVFMAGVWFSPQTHHVKRWGVWWRSSLQHCWRRRTHKWLHHAASAAAGFSAPSPSRRQTLSPTGARDKICYASLFCSQVTTEIHAHTNTLSILRHRHDMTHVLFIYRTWSSQTVRTQHKETVWLSFWVGHLKTAQYDQKYLLASVGSAVPAQNKTTWNIITAQ